MRITPTRIEPFLRPRAAATAEEVKPKRGKRKLRAGTARAAGAVWGAFNACNGVAQGLVAGYMANREYSPGSIRKAVAATQLSCSVLGGAALGTLVGGPAGLVCGAAAGYVAGSLENYMEHRSQQLDQLLEHLETRIDRTTEEARGVWGTVKAMGVGAVTASKLGWRHGNVSGSSVAAGAMAGVRHLREEKCEDSGQRPQPKSLLERASGLLFGAAGVLINGPAGAVLGALESVHHSEKPEPTGLSRHLLLLATNLGKVLPGVLVGSMVPGPVGILAGTVVGVLTASITSMVDGRRGFHPGLVRAVRGAVDDSHGEEECPDSARVFFRGGKGAVVGLVTGVREGWKTGYDAGIQLLRDGLSGPEISVGEEISPPDPVKRSPAPPASGPPADGPAA